MPSDFFPNNENHPGRRFRMQKAVKHGAGREVKWSAAVTHLVVDRSMNYEQVCGFLSTTEKLEQIPVRIHHFRKSAYASPNADQAHVHIVNENYPADCISYRSLVDPQQKQYEVRGFEPQRHDPELSRQKAAAAPSSLELKPAGKAVQSKQPQTPSQNTVATTITDPSPQQRSSPPWLRPPPPVPEQDNGAIIAKETFTEQDELGRAIEEAKQAQGLVRSPHCLIDCGTDYGSYLTKTMQRVDPALVGARVTALARRQTFQSGKRNSSACRRIL